MFLVDDASTSFEGHPKQLTLEFVSKDKLQTAFDVTNFPNDLAVTNIIDNEYYIDTVSLTTSVGFKATFNPSVIEEDPETKIMIGGNTKTKIIKFKNDIPDISPDVTNVNYGGEDNINLYYH